MAEALARKRGFAAMWLMASAVALSAAAWVTTRPAAGVAAPEGGLPAAPALAAGEAQARKISVSSREGAYTLVRSPRGWVLSERGDFPVSADKVAALQQAIAALRFERAMTRDPAKLDRLSLGDPAAGGRGVAVQIEDARAAPLVDLVFGFEERGLYARERGASQAWAVAGDLPALASPASWIAAPASLKAERFARIDLAPVEGPGYALVADETGGLALGRPYSWRRIVAPGLAAGVLQTLQSFTPQDVQPAPAIGGAPRARVVAYTADGLRVEADLHREGEAWWLKLSAPMPQGEVAEEVLARLRPINAELAPWAFRLTPEAAAALAPSLMDLTGAEARDLAPPPRPAAPAGPAPSAAPGSDE